MKTLLTLSLALLTTGAFSQVIFSEDFNNSVGMPAGFTMINNDGLTPATNVAYVNDAWINRVDFITPSDSCAFSTSWYTPAGTSDDWMITPLIAINPGATVSLEWEALAPDAAYPDGYEVWVSTGAATVAGMTGGTMVYSTAAEAQVWTPHNIDISAFAGSSVYVGFRNNNTDMFLLMVDSIVVTEIVLGAADAAMIGTPSEYTMIPLSQVTPLGTAGTIDNVGTAPLTNAVMTVNVYDGTMANVYTGSSAPAAIAIGANSPATVPGFTPLAADVYTIEQIVSVAEADVNILNDTSYYQVAVTDFTYGRDDGNVANLLGVGAGATAVVGQNYELIAAETMESVTFLIAPGAPALGDTVRVSIYDVDGTGMPTTQIGQSAEYILTTADTTAAGALLTLDVTDMSAGALALGVGNYFVGIDEYNAMANMAIAHSTDIFTPNAAWISINGGAFATSEALGFAGAYVVRPNFLVCLPTAASITASTCSVYTAPSGATFSTTGIHTDIIPNACGADSVITIDLTVGANSTATVNATECVLYTAPSGATFTATGTYTDIIPNSCGGDSVITINLTVPVLDLSVTEAGGTITSGATGGVTYQWIDCGTLAPVAGETNQTFTATTDGDYAVIVADGACSDTSACTTITVGGLNDLAANGRLEIYPNPSNGDFTIDIVGITADAVSIEVVDYSGRVVEARTFNNVHNQLVATMNVNVEAGSYLVRISANGETTVQTIVISK